MSGVHGEALASPTSAHTKDLKPPAEAGTTLSIPWACGDGHSVFLDHDFVIFYVPLLLKTHTLVHNVS